MFTGGTPVSNLLSDGKITSEMFHQLVALLNQTKQIQAGPGIRVTQGVTGTAISLDGLYLPQTERLVAELSAATLMSGFTNRWLYTWHEVEITKDASGVVTFTRKTGGRVGTNTETQAFNLAEAFHGSDDVEFGVDTAGTDYPAGFTSKPIVTGGVSVAVVLEHPLNTNLYYFYSQGVHDGTCT